MNKTIFRKLTYILVLSIYSVTSVAQKDTLVEQHGKFLKNLGLNAMYQNGHVFATNEFLRGNNAEAEKIKSYQAFALKLLKQTKGDKLWEQIYRYPNWGIGIYTADFYNPEEIGNPVAVYAFFNAPFLRQNRFSFNYEFGFGATFNWQSYNPLTNQYNKSIGAGESFLIDAGIDIAYRIFKQVEIKAGVGLTHFSNGGLKVPNLGLNTIAPKISLRYNFFDRYDFKKQEVPEYKDRNEWLFSLYGGLKNVVYDSLDVSLMEKYEGVFYPETGLSMLYNRQLSYKSKIGMGITFSYDGSIDAQVAVDNGEVEPVKGPFKDKILISIYPSYELVAHKVSLIIQPAFYIYRKTLKSQSPMFHQRIGLKYHITDHVFAGITLRAYDFHVSDFVEWSLGYRLR